VNTHLLDRITEETRAASQYVLPNEDLEVKVSSFFAKIKDPVLTQPALAFPAKAATRLLYPSPLPDLFSGEQLVLVGRYSDAANGAVELTGQTGDKQQRFAEDVKFEAVSTDNEFIARLWATRRIGWLINEIRLRGESAELKDEVTTLAREHGIVTPYTAWLIVEDEQRRGVRPELQTLRQTPANRDALSYSESSFRNLSVQQSGAVWPPKSVTKTLKSITR
jgi:Ca-activated chloride channel family protein